MTSLLPEEWGLAFVAAGALALAGSAGAMRETGVHVAGSTRLTAVTAPQGLAERIERVPTPAPGEPQVRIESYEMPGGESRFAVYIAGTMTFDPLTGAEPFDLASNIANAAGDESAAVEAVRAAMAEAGVTETTPVQLIGYSQGAATAARIAQDAGLMVDSLVTVGGPVGQIAVPSTVTAVHLAYTDDVVTALGGTYADPGAVLVQREAFDGRALPDDLPLPAHQLATYRETAELVDAHRQPLLQSTIATVDAFTAGADAVSATTYRLDREVRCTPE